MRFLHNFSINFYPCLRGHYSMSFNAYNMIFSGNLLWNVGILYEQKEYLRVLHDYVKHKLNFRFSLL